jgi:hypothetical protein
MIDGGDVMTYRAIAAIAMLAGFTLLAGLPLGSAGAQAADGDANSEANAKRVFAENYAAKGKSYACFVRRYDAAHLAQHRQQKVTAMKLLVSAELVPEDNALNYSFHLATNMRDRKDALDSGGTCGHPTISEDSAGKLQLGCGVDCDGGGVTIAMTNDDKSVHVEIERVAMWSNAKGDDERISFSSGADDRLFRLDRAKLSECSALIPKEEDEEPPTQ